MNPPAVILHVILPSNDFDDTIPTRDEMERAKSFRFQEDLTRWLSFRTSMRRILGTVLGMPPQRVPILTTHAGKPHLAPPFSDLHFSISHTNDLAILAISGSGPVGVDVEPAARSVDLLGCEASFCHPMEIRMLPSDRLARARSLLELWTMKEAVLKAIGTGFLLPPESIRIESTGSSLFHAVDDGTEESFRRQIIQIIRHPLLSSYQVAVSCVSQVWELAPDEASTGPVQSDTVSGPQGTTHG